jgi:tetratricopeptide (TPR) repeat protein
MLMSVYQYFVLRHYLIEGLRIASKVIDAPKVPECPELARVMNMASFLAQPLGDSEAAREYALRSIALARRLGDKSLVARARTTLGFVEEDTGRPVRARRHYLQAVAVFRRLDQEVFLTKLLINLAGVEPDLGLHKEAREHLVEAEALLKRHPDPTLRGYLHQNFAHLELASGAPRSSLSHTVESLKILDAAQDLNGIATSLRNAAYALEALGRLDRAAIFVGAARGSARRMEQKIRPDHEAAFQRLSVRISQNMGAEVFREFVFEGGEASVSDLVDMIASKI